ncbi:hypothetical protein EB001_18795, partial [bacterium]|nr:hypothetical protein [bacterium]
GGFDFIGDIIDTGGDILGGIGDAVGDVAGGIGDVIGDVAGGIGDLVGSLDLADAAKAFIMSGGNPWAAAVAATNIDESLGFNPGSFLSGDFSDFGGGMDVGGGGFDFSAPDFSSMDFGDYNQLGSAYDTTSNVLGSSGDIIDYGDYLQLGQDVTPGNIEAGNQALNDYYNAGDYSQLGQIVTPGNIEAGNQAIQDYLNNPVSTAGIGDTIQGGLDTAIEWYKKYGKPAAAVGKLITSYYAGQLSKQQQEELNRKIQAEYDAYNAKKSQFANQIASGSLPKLNISRGTYSPVRGYTPVYAAKGGSIRGQYAGGGLTDLLASLTMPSMEDILGGFEKYGEPISQLLKYGLSYGAGQLSKKQQEELNRKIQAEYNKYNQEKEAFSDLISSGKLAKMDIQKGSTPIVTAARGGIMNVKPRVRSNLGIMGVNR